MPLLVRTVGGACAKMSCQLQGSLRTPADDGVSPRRWNAPSALLSRTPAADKQTHRPG
jgi:hypothetical protein